jgi:hypothetical protein
LASSRLGSLLEPSGRLIHGRPQPRWNPPECQVPSSRVPAAVVMTDPLSKDRANVPFAHRNHEPKPSWRIVPITRSQKAFACGARAGVFKTLRPIASSVRVNAFRVDRVAIVDDESIHLVAVTISRKLLRRPACGRIRRHIPVQNPPGADLEPHEHVHDAERRRHGRSRGPIGRGSVRMCSMLASPPHRPRRQPNAQLQQELVGDAFSPHVRFAAPIVAISRCTSREIAGRPDVRDFQRRTVGIPADASESACRLQRSAVTDARRGSATDPQG